MTLTTKFWGTRGSIPCPASPDAVQETLKRVLHAAEPSDIADEKSIDEFIKTGCGGALATRYGGNTACVEVRAESGERLLIDFGSGARSFALDLVESSDDQQSISLDILMSHLHWDHIQGFPFFTPAFAQGNALRIHGCHDGIEDAFRDQMSPPFFPVPFESLDAEISFHRVSPGTKFEISGFEVTPFLLPHAGDAYAYRIERDGRSIVYASDGEHKPENIGPNYPFVDFVRGADVLIFDAQYSFVETVSAKEDWGHSSNLAGIGIALLGGVKELVLFHHEPQSTDVELDGVLEESRRYEELVRGDRPPLSITSAWDGLEISLA